MTFKTLTYFVIREADGKYLGGSPKHAALGWRSVPTVAEALKYPSHRGAARVSNKLPGSKIETIEVPNPDWGKDDSLPPA